MIKQFTALCLLFISTHCAFSQSTYPDNNLPGDTPQLFARGILTDGLANRDFTISPKGDEIFFTVQHLRFASFILRVAKVKGVWGKPEMAPFSGVFADLEATFSADGNTIFFVSNRPLKGSQPKDYDIWKVSRGADGKWGEPVNLGPTVNTDKNEYYPSVAKNGNLYFTVEAPYGKGGEDIVVCKKTADGYAAPESLPEAINSKTGEFNAFVDPDEQFIIFGAESRAGRVGSGDLYMSKKNDAGIWQPARQLPVPINSTGLDYCPYVTADKKYLIFTSNRLRKEWDSDKAVTYDEMKNLITEPGNGLDDIYWVKFNPDW
ncbi:hypothetical protein [Mucilaginibacter flavidus]|uniref:hypothetical protein n=1 Tax=Mucilaginibacter flavidus TaxID=2949309 RepID=UPI0020921696|nr:hypothetical protein [Mucilaginibacter flavidus]MCO5950448.1 hypothetical protein [Mucilaginibacter flavidus]